MTAGRPRKTETGRLYALAHHFYWELKTIDEGLFRSRVGREKRELLIRESEESARLNAQELAELERGVRRQIQAGWLPENQREDRIRELKEDFEFERRFVGRNAAMELSSKPIKIPPEPEVIDDLLNAKASDQIKKICRDAFTTSKVKDETGETIEVAIPNWTISGSSLLPRSLSQFASEFIEAKSDPRFPTSGRPTSRLKQLWFLSRALAGAVHGLRTRTAINLIGSVRPDETIQLSELTKRTRRSKKAAKKRT